MIVIRNNTGLGSIVRNLVSALRLGHYRNDQVVLQNSNKSIEFILSYDQLGTMCLPGVEDYTTWRLQDPESTGGELLDPDNIVMIVDSVSTVPAQGIDFQYANIRQEVRNKWLTYFDLIHWNPDIIEVANDLYQQYQLEGAVGLHIRSWHDDAFRKNALHNTQMFVNAVLETNAERVFLCCDSIEIENDLENLLGSRVKLIKQNFQGERHIAIDQSVETMVHALLDLFLLSKCSTIIGTYQSSFSELAWWIGRCQNKVTIPVPEYARILNEEYKCKKEH